MIAKTALAAIRPWVLGAWAMTTAWLTAVSIGSATGLPGGSIGRVALLAWSLLSFSIHLTSRRMSPKRKLMLPANRLAAPLIAAATILVISLLLAPAMPLMSRISLTLGAGLVPASLLSLTGRIARRSRLISWGAAIAHLGAALALIGIATATGLSSETRVVAQPGERIAIGPWLVDYSAVVPVAGPDFTAIEAELRATRGTGVAVLRPQSRTGIAPPVESSAPAVVTAWNGRLTIDLRQARGDGHELEAKWMPLVTLLWIGGGLMVIGGLIGLAGLRGAWTALVVALLSASIAGYALFGRSGVSEPATGATTPHRWPSLVEQRGAFLGQFHRSSHWLIISDSYATRGQTRDAAAILQAATRQHPRDYALWLGLGNALTEHGRGLNPAARLAFARSAELAPTSPAPGYFLGLAKLRSGDRAGALADWRSVLADAPADASWRPIVEDGVASIGGSGTPR